MRKWLLTSLSTFLVGGAVSNITYNEKILNNTKIIDEQNNNKKILNREVVSVSGWILEETIIDMSIYDETSSEEDIKWDIFTSIAAQNEYIPELEDAIFDILYSEDLWKISGLDYKIPGVGEEKLYNVRVTALRENELYKGILKAPIRYINQDTSIPEQKSLSDDIEFYELEKIVNPTVKLLEETFKSKNKKVKMDEVYLDYYDYSKIIYKVKPTSEYYSQGSVEIEYDSEINWQIEEFKSGFLEVEAYNSTQTKNNSKTYVYKPEFGVAKFKTKFKGIQVFHTGKGYISNQSGNINKTLEESSTITFNKGVETIFYNEYYGSVNWNWYQIKVAFSFYLDSEIRITFNVDTQAYASWMNAYYSRAGVELNVQDIVFI